MNLVLRPFSDLAMLVMPLKQFIDTVPALRSLFAITSGSSCCCRIIFTKLKFYFLDPMWTHLLTGLFCLVCFQSYPELGPIGPEFWDFLVTYPVPIAHRLHCLVRCLLRVAYIVPRVCYQQAETFSPNSQLLHTKSWDAEDILFRSYRIIVGIWGKEMCNKTGGNVYTLPQVLKMYLPICSIFTNTNLDWTY